MRPTAIYSRASKGSGRSITEQLDANRAVAAEHPDWNTPAEYGLTDRSASRYARKEREDWARLLADMDAGRLDHGVIILWEPSRADRKLTSWSRFLDECIDRRMLVWITDHERGYDPNNSADWEALARAGVASVHEVNLLSSRIRRGLRGNATNGRPHGKISYGWTRLRDPDTGKTTEQVLDVHQAVVIREIASRVVAGEPCLTIGRDLDRRGEPAPAGGRWHRTSIKKLILRPSNIGMLAYQGKIVGPGNWPAILDEATYYACVRRLTDPARRTIKDGLIKYLMSGLAVCGPCGGPMYAEHNARRSVYTCKGRGQDGSRGFCTSIAMGRLDDFVEAVIVERLSRPDVADLIAAPADGAARDARARVLELEQRLAELYAEAAAGRLSAVGLAAVEAQLLPDLEAARAAETRVVRSPLVASVAGPDAATAWDELDLMRRRALVSALLTVAVNPVGRGVWVDAIDRVTVEWKE